MSEAANIKQNVTDLMNQIITYSRALATQLSRAEFGEQNKGRNLIQDIMVVSYCTMYFSHMSANELEEIVENTLEYFKTGLCDTDSATGTSRDHNSSYIVRTWVYTPDTHNDAGHWVFIYAFNNIWDAEECITMLKEIEAELKKIN